MEQVQVGTAVRSGDGFVLRLGELSIGGEPVRASRAAAPRAAAPAPAAPISPAGLGPLPTVFPPYGRSKGAPIAGASRSDLDYYANGSRRSLSDPSKTRFHDKERAMLAAIEAEIQRQGGAPASSGGGFDEDPPPPQDSDRPPEDY
jgi:hypothetical protein